MAGLPQRLPLQHGEAARRESLSCKARSSCLRRRTARKPKPADTSSRSFRCVAQCECASVRPSIVRCRAVQCGTVPYRDSTMQSRAVLCSAYGRCTPPSPAAPSAALQRSAPHATAPRAQADGVFVCLCVCVFVCARRTSRPRSGTRAAPTSGRRRFGRAPGGGHSCARASLSYRLGGCSCCGSEPRRCKVASRVGPTLRSFSESSLPFIDLLPAYHGCNVIRPRCG